MVQGSKEWLDKYFPIVEVSRFSLEQKFMKHKPVSYNEEWVMKNLTSALKSGLKNFRRPVMAPSLKGEQIVYEEGLESAVGKSAWWWKENARLFLPEKNSRVGNELNFAATLGQCINQLVEEKEYDVRTAWHEICNDSRKVYELFESPVSAWNWNNEKMQKATKIIMSSENEYCFMFAGYDPSKFHIDTHPLGHVTNVETTFDHMFSVGWIITDV